MQIKGSGRANCPIGHWIGRLGETPLKTLGREPGPHNFPTIQMGPKLSFPTKMQGKPSYL
jgi:hypothetical protein